MRAELLRSEASRVRGRSHTGSDSQPRPLTQIPALRLESDLSLHPQGYRIWLAAWMWQRARRLLHLSPRAGRGRFASGALAKRSKSGEGACSEAQARGYAPSPGFLAALGIRLLPARGERWRKRLCLAPQDTNSNAIALPHAGRGGASGQPACPESANSSCALSPDP